VDLHLFKSRNFSIGATTQALAATVHYGNIVLLPLWLQQYGGYTATWAGLVVAPAGLISIVAQPIVGRLLMRIDARWFMTLGCLTFALVNLMRSHLNFDASFGSLYLPQLIQGLATATLFMPLYMSMVGGLPQQQIATASGITNFMMQASGAIGISLATSLWDHGAGASRAQLVAHVNAYDSAAVQTMGSMSTLGLDPQAALALLQREVEIQAFTISINDFYRLSWLLFLVLLFAIWQLRPTQIRESDVQTEGMAAHG
jgi:DHA2 family multidrug resistance protein